MSEMIERVARAIYGATPRNKPYSFLTKFKRNALEAEARAAIGAMREPLEQMIDTGANRARDNDRKMQNAPGYNGECRDIYRAMIDAALSTPDEK